MNVSHSKKTIPGHYLAGDSKLICIISREVIFLFAVSVLDDDLLVRRFAIYLDM